jgi:hypothetical protein
MTGVSSSAVMEPVTQTTSPASELECFGPAVGAWMRDRVAARWHSQQLDRALAAGAPAESTAPLALRARRLTASCRRRSIARAYRSIVHAARDGVRPSYAQVTPCRSHVTAAADQLTRLAEALAQPGPVAARGAAQALLLLTDGTGPLYNPRSDASLRACAAKATEHLKLSGTH